VQDSVNILEAIYFRFRRTIVERVTVVKFRVDDRGRGDTSCFRIMVKTDTAKITDMRISGLRKKVMRSDQRR